MQSLGIIDFGKKAIFIYAYIIIYICMHKYIYSVKFYSHYYMKLTSVLTLNLGGGE